jgi:hypothetical protein
MDVSTDGMCSVTVGRLFGICGRMTTADFDNAIEAYLAGDGTAVDIKLFSEVAGVRVENGSYDANIVAGTMTNLKLECRTVGGVLAVVVYVDTVSRITKTYLTDVLAGNNYAGIIGNGNNINTVRLTNFLSESVAAATGHPTMRRWGHVPHMGTTVPRLAGIR